MAKDERLTVLSRANSLFSKGRLEQALEEYMKLLTLDPDDLEVRRIVGNISLKLGQTARAVTHFEIIGGRYAETRELARAIAVYKRVAQLDPDNENATLRLADLYRQVGLAGEAKPLYLILAEKNRKRKNHETALSMLEAAGRLFPGDRDTDLRRLDILNETNALNEAETLLKKILAHDPDNADLLEKLGRIYIQQKKYDDAFRLFNPAIDQLIAAGKYDEAAAVLRLIISAFPDHLPSLSKMAAIFKKSGKTNRLLILYESMLAIYKKQNLKNEIRETLRELIAIADNPAVYAQQLKRMNDEDRQAADEEKKKNEEKEWVSFQLKQADVSIAMRNFAKAADLLQKTKQVFPRNLEIREKLFQILSLSGDNDNALKEGRELLKMFDSQGMNERYFQLSAQMEKIDPGKVVETDLWKERTGYEIAIDLSSLDAARPSAGAVAQPSSETPPPVKSVREYAREADFYLNEGFIDDAAKLLREAEKFYPSDREIAGRVKWVYMLQKSSNPTLAATQPELDIDFEES